MKKIFGFIFIFSVMAAGTFYPIIVGDSKALPGDERDFDFLSHQKQIEDFIQMSNPKIEKFSIYNVAASGGVNLTDSRNGNIEAIFSKNNKAIQVTFSTPRYTRNLSRGGGIATDYSFYYLGMTKTEASLPVSERNITWPKCDLKCVWDQAIAAGADASKKAEVSYDNTGITFTIRMSPKNFVIKIPKK